jgi:chromosome segregation ATPase
VQSRAEVDKREMAQKHEREVRSLMEKVEQHIKTNSEQVDKIQSISQQNMRSLREHELKYDQLNEIKRNLEVENKEQRQKIELLSYELELAKDQTNQVKNELKDVRETNKGLDTTKFTQEKSLTEYTLRIQSLHRELEDKETLLLKSQALLDSNRA